MHFIHVPAGAHRRRHDGVLPPLRRDQHRRHFHTTAYPRFDPERGGSITGVLDALNRVLEIAVPGENQKGGTVIVPGRGRLSDETEVANYRDMVTIVRDRVRRLVAEGP